MSSADTLARVAAVLKQTIAPAVGEEYARTQAHMAAVVVDKLARELALAAEHAAARAEDLDTLAAQLEAFVIPKQGATAAAIQGFIAQRDDAALDHFVATLHAERAVLGTQTCDQLLALVRRQLRRELDRRLAYAT